MNGYDDTVFNAVNALPAADRAEAQKGLETPDMYPATIVANYLGVPLAKVYAWRKQRGIRRSKS